MVVYTDATIHSPNITLTITQLTKQDDASWLMFSQSHKEYSLQSSGILYL